MSKRPKIPLDSKPPWERRLDEEYPYVTATEIQARQRAADKKLQEIADANCNNPRCSGCNPQNFINGQYVGPKGDENMASGPSDLHRAALYELMRNESRFRGMQDFMLGDFQQVKAPQQADTLAPLRKPIAQWVLKIEHKQTWEDFIGNDEARNAMFEAVEASAKHKDLYDFYSMIPPKGVVLHGPPGCGKTFLAKVTASRLTQLYGKDAEMILVNGSELESKWLGETETNIRNIFAYARAYAEKNKHPLVIFIDEADSFLPPRGGNRFQDGVVGTFLAEMDGLNTNGAFVILATNRVEEIDSALLRDGRCSRKIKVRRPGVEEAKLMLHRSIRDAPLAHEMLMESLAGCVTSILDYFLLPSHVIETAQLYKPVSQEVLPVQITLSHIMNGAMLTQLMNRAKAFAFRRDLARGERSGITLQDFYSAIDELVTENKGITHNYALMEMAEQLNLRERTKGMN